MARQTGKATRAASRNQGKALQLVVVGLFLIVLPQVISNPAVAAGLKTLSMVGWLLLVVGCVGVWLLRQKPGALPGIAVPQADPPPAPVRQPVRRSSSPLLVERSDPVMPASPSVVPQPHVAAAPPSRPSSWSPAVFAVIEWRRFEAVIEALFAQAGFVTKAQSHGPDEGVDVWLYSKNQPDGAPVSVVQCKHWPGKPVGVDKVRELRGVMAAKGVTRGQFAATGGFTPDALAFAAKNSIKPHDMAGLLDLIGKRTPAQQEALLAVALDGEYWRPTCVNCGIKLIERQPQTGGKPFWGCSNFPRCRTTMQMRGA